MILVLAVSSSFANQSLFESTNQNLLTTFAMRLHRCPVAALVWDSSRQPDRQRAPGTELQASSTELCGPLPVTATLFLVQRFVCACNHVCVKPCANIQCPGPCVV
jgi:hypothetical protein